MVLAIMVANVFVKNQIYFKDHEQRANSFYANSSLYSSELQRDLVAEMNQNKSEDERIDWRVNEQDNTPMYQGFKGLSLYSSIFYYNILDFYYDALKINMAEESLSRYQSINGRQNLASLLSVKYVMLKDYQQNVPSYFKKVKSVGQYTIYENTLQLPSVKVTNQYYNSHQFKSVIDREHAMLNGVITEDFGTKFDSKAKNLLSEVDISTHNIKKLDSTHLKVVGKRNGTITLNIPKSLRNQYKDFYITLKVKRGQPDSNYTVSINQYENHRLYNDSTYRTGVDTQLYRAVPDKNGNITIDLSPKGTFEFKLIELNEENYQTLRKAHHDANLKQDYKDIKNGVKVHLDSHQKGIAVINIPYRKGMTAKVAGKKVNVQQVNYMMTGVPVNKDARQIIIHYQPSYWNIMILISLISIVISVCISYLFKRQKRKKR